ncbi:tyrosine-type recombinase/integrase, partial [Staphylococcus aureus]
VQECGMRISELCTLKKGCLLEDKDGDYFLKYYQWKMKKEHIVPIS